MIIFSSGLIDESVQVASNKSNLIGYSLYSDDASGAELKIYNGTSNSGVLVGHLIVVQNDMKTYALPSSGLRCPDGIYAEITGTGEALVYYNR